MPDSIARVWDIVEKVGVGMLTTRFDGGLRARPLEPRLDRVAGVIRFVTDIRGAKDDEVEAAPDACFIVIEPKGKAYLSISGHAIIIRDRDIAGRNLGKGPTTPGGRVAPTIRTCAYWNSGPRRRSSGTVRQARSSRRLNLPRRGSLAKSRTSARTASPRSQWAARAAPSVGIATVRCPLWGKGDIASRWVLSAYLPKRASRRLGASLQPPRMPRFYCSVRAWELWCCSKPAPLTSSVLAIVPTVTLQMLEVTFRALSFCSPMSRGHGHPANPLGSLVTFL